MASTGPTSRRAGHLRCLKPWQNGFAQSFVWRLGDAFLDGEVLLWVLDARTRLVIWRRYYNEERLHSRIGYQTPRAFAAKLAGIEQENGRDQRVPWYYGRGLTTSCKAL